MCFLGKCSSQKCPLLLTAGKSTNLAIAEIFKFHCFKALINCSTVLFPKPSPPTEGLVSSHFHHAPHRDREIPVNRRPLRQISDFRDGQASAMTMETYRSR